MRRESAEQRRRGEPFAAPFPNDIDRLSQLEEFEMAEGQPDIRNWEVFTAEGEKVGSVSDLIASPSTNQVYFALVSTGFLRLGRDVCLPLRDVRLDAGEQHLETPYSRQQYENAPPFDADNPDYRAQSDYWLRGAPPAEAGARREERPAREMGEERHVPVAEEEIVTHRESHPAGEVQVSKHVVTEERHVRVPVTRTDVQVERREVSEQEAAGYFEEPGRSREFFQEGEVMRIPIVEEEVVVEKRPRIREEVVIRTVSRTEEEDRTVPVRREEVEIHRPEEEIRAA